MRKGELSRPMTHHVCMLLGILANVACLTELYF